MISGFLLRLILSTTGTLALDQNTFIAWGNRAAELGFGSFYNEWSDYLPGFIYVLAFLSKIGSFIPFPTELLFKLPAITGDLLAGYLIYKIALKKSKKLAEFLVALIIFNPAIFANSTLWGQVDIFSGLLSLASIYFFPSNWLISSFSLALGASIKPQAALAAPVIFALMLNQKWKFNKILKYGIFSGILVLLIFMPFSNQNDLFLFISERLNQTLNQYPYTSINAFNFWGLFGFWKPDEIGLTNPKLIGSFLLGITSLISIKKVKNNPDKKYHALALLLLANFLFFTRMHERHLLPTLIPLIAASAFSPNLLIPYIALSITYVANLYYSYIWITEDFKEVFSPLFIGVFIGVNILSFIFVFRETLLKKSNNIIILFKNKWKKLKSNDLSVPSTISDKKAKKIIFLILIFALISKLFILHHPEKHYFDEIYHAFTAQKILENDQRPWHWSSQHPEGYAFEWTHPPLAKEAMALSMGLLGTNSFAWRLPGVLLSLLLIYITYKITLFFTKSQDASLIAAFLITMDGLVLTMSRIGTADIYFVSFTFASYYFYLKKKNLPSSIFLGLAAASKWSTLWFLPILAISHFALKRKFTFSYLWFLVIPPLVYLLSYAPMFQFFDFETFIGLQKQMWWYHSGLEAEHPYTSQWWTWPLLIRPVYLFQNFDAKTQAIENIYALGNPVVFWFGLSSVIASIYLSIKLKIKSLALLVYGYIAFFAPWALSPRIMFIYHYLPSIPFMVIISSIIIRKYKILIWPAIILSLLAFIYFYPHWTAIKVPQNIDQSYYWFQSWR